MGLLERPHSIAAGAHCICMGGTGRRDLETLSGTELRRVPTVYW